MTRGVRSIAGIKRANRAAGLYWFEPDTIQFFNSRVMADVYPTPEGDAYFVSSEQYDDDAPRLYTVRKFFKTSGRIDTVGEFQGYATADDARAAIRELLSAGVPS